MNFYCKVCNTKLEDNGDPLFEMFWEDEHQMCKDLKYIYKINVTKGVEQHGQN